MTDFPEIHTTIEEAEESPPTLLARGAVKNLLLRLLPPDSFYSDEEGEEQISAYLPLLKWVEWSDFSTKMSIYLVSPHQDHAARFFLEMISRWLLPGKRLSIPSFYTTEWRMENALFMVSEIVLSFEDRLDLEQARRQIAILDSELRLGLTSVYHAKRILEIKGLSSDEKTALIQERISQLLRRRIRGFDYGIFHEMQQFLVGCSEEFKSIRESAHLCRIISRFYLLRQRLQKEMERSNRQSIVHVKIFPVRLHLPLGIEKALGIMIALKFQGENEVFDQRNFEEVLKAHFSEFKVVPASCFSSPCKEKRTQILYLEVEKQDGSAGALEEIKALEQQLPGEIKRGIEKIAHPLFMPRNEEEVLRNMILLSKQLKYFRDIPQAILSFDGQVEGDLEYTVIWVRILKENDLPIEALLKKKSSRAQFSSDRIKQLGMLRKKYPKEATVFRVKMASAPFLRPDHCIDLFKARQALVVELVRLLGEFRDYNGGMIAKQHEQFVALKGVLPNLDRKEEILLDSFFHSIYPIELRSVFPLDPLKKMFLMLLEAVHETAKEKTFYQEDEEGCYFLLLGGSESVHSNLAHRLIESQASCPQLLTLSLALDGIPFLGAVYYESDQIKREQFRLDFCRQTGHNKGSIA